MRTIVVVALLATASCATVEPLRACEALDPTYRVFGPELTIPQLEEIGTTLAQKNPSVPQVPFAMGNKSWERLKAKYKPGDLFRAFDGPRWTDGAPIAGGYILLRGQCVVGQIVTSRS